MKNLISLLVAFTFFSSFAIGQIVAITYRDPFPAVGGCTWCNKPFPVCNSELRDFYIAFDNQGIPSGCKLGSNPYRITLTFYKNNHQPITSIQMQTSGAWLNFPTSSLMNIPVNPGTYYAEAKFEVRRCIIGWQEKGTYRSNSIIVSALSASPDFNINGFAPNSNGTPYQVCGGSIKLNAANSLCESNYYIGIQESNQWWDRTYDYEWGLWFSGPAPNNINLQQLATTYSYPPYFNGNALRQGSPLISGNISGVQPPGNVSLIGQPRYYRVVFATGQPNWSPKYLLINVNSNCIMPNGDNEILTRAMDILVKQFQEGNVPSLLEKPTFTAYNNVLSKSIILEYQLSEEDTIDISIINSSEQKIAKIVSNKIHESGNYVIEHSSQGWPQGVYTIVFTTSKDKLEKQLVIK